MRLFGKIFLWFWATVVLTGIALILTFMLGRNSVPAHWHQMMENTARYLGTVTVREMDRAGRPAASASLADLESKAHLKACLFDPNGSPVTGRQCGDFADLAHAAARSVKDEIGVRFGIPRAAVLIPGASGLYIFATELPTGPRMAFGENRFSFLFDWAVALAVSGGVCYALARYLTAPILQLRAASRQLAQGELASRAAPGMERRADELGELVGDFNAMADRIEQLVSGQRQLIYDVSHELRSPLARLTVALDLIRERKGGDPALDHAEQDVQAMGEMAGRLLTVARLDTSREPVPFAPVELNELAAKIVEDAQFESSVEVRLTAEGEFKVEGNAELLRSALENVIRNAIRFTDPDTAVQVELKPEDGFVRVVVRDFGPGIPESELANIFRPFYRVSEARDRESGGVGLGLAITQRVVALHHGTIAVKNVPPRGLAIEIKLPMCERL